MHLIQRANIIEFNLIYYWRNNKQSLILFALNNQFSKFTIYYDCKTGINKNSVEPGKELNARLIEIVPEGHGLVIFDGECVLCNATVAILLKYDKSKKLFFTSLKPEIWAFKPGIPESGNNAANSVTLYFAGHIFTESDAVLEIARLLGGKFKITLAGYIIPAFIRNRIYRLIARNRYKWFGKRAHCFIPPKADRHRFIP